MPDKLNLLIGTLLKSYNPIILWSIFENDLQYEQEYLFLSKNVKQVFVISNQGKFMSLMHFVELIYVKYNCQSYLLNLIIVLLGGSQILLHEQ